MDMHAEYDFDYIHSKTNNKSYGSRDRKKERDTKRYAKYVKKMQDQTLEENYSRRTQEHSKRGSGRMCIKAHKVKNSRFQ